MEKKCKIIYLNNFIYILSDDEIKLGDWSYNIVNKTIFQADSQFVKLINQKEVTTNKKIIATTDTSLNNCAVMHCSEKCIDYCVYKNDLPQPSLHFITKYIEEYNKGNIITDVLVEYEQPFPGHSSIFDCLKINPKDNTITIKELKDSWNREEVFALITTFNNAKVEVPNIVKWIEENL